MTNPINGFGFSTPPSFPSTSLGNAEVVSTGDTSPFEKLLLDSLGQANAMQQSAQAAVEKSLVGEDISQIEVLTSMKKADLALRMITQIRNKLMDAYNEIKQMQM